MGGSTGLQWEGARDVEHPAMLISKSTQRKSSRVTAALPQRKTGRVLKREAYSPEPAVAVTEIINERNIFKKRPISGKGLRCFFWSSYYTYWDSLMAQMVRICQ